MYIFTYQSTVSQVLEASYNKQAKIGNKRAKEQKRREHDLGTPSSNRAAKQKKQQQAQ